jgi:hypothetical protein
LEPESEKEGDYANCKGDPRLMVGKKDTAEDAQNENEHHNEHAVLACLLRMR